MIQCNLWFHVISCIIGIAYEGICGQQDTRINKMHILCIRYNVFAAYNSWRLHCNLPTADNFDDLIDIPENRRDVLKELYKWANSLYQVYFKLNHEHKTWIFGRNLISELTPYIRYISNQSMSTRLEYSTFSKYKLILWFRVALSYPTTFHTSHLTQVTWLSYHIIPYYVISPHITSHKFYISSRLYHHITLMSHPYYM